MYQLSRIQVDSQTDNPRHEDQKQDLSPTNQTGRRTQLHQGRHKMAEQYDCDRELLESRNSDLNLIMFAAVSFAISNSILIASVKSQLRDALGDGTTTSLRTLIRELSITALGKDFPPLPQSPWTRHPRALAQVHVICIASFTASVLTASLAMIAKLRHFKSTNTRESTTERGQDRRWKLCGINAWHLDTVMPSLWLMLLASVLLFGFSFSRHMWAVGSIFGPIFFGTTSFCLILTFVRPF